MIGRSGSESGRHVGERNPRHRPIVIWAFAGVGLLVAATVLVSGDGDAALVGGVVLVVASMAAFWRATRLIGRAEAAEPGDADG